MWLLFKNNAHKLGSSETELWHSLHGRRCSGALTAFLISSLNSLSLSSSLFPLNALTPTPSQTKNKHNIAYSGFIADSDFQSVWLYSQLAQAASESETH